MLHDSRPTSAFERRKSTCHSFRGFQGVRPFDSAPDTFFVPDHQVETRPKRILYSGLSACATCAVKHFPPHRPTCLASLPLQHSPSPYPPAPETLRRQHAPLHRACSLTKM